MGGELEGSGSRWGKGNCDQNILYKFLIKTSGKCKLLFVCLYLILVLEMTLYITERKDGQL